MMDASPGPEESPALRWMIAGLVVSVAALAAAGVPAMRLAGLPLALCGAAMAITGLVRAQREGVPAWRGWLGTVCAAAAGVLGAFPMGLL